jgi:hypothetical protein
MRPQEPVVSGPELSASIAEHAVYLKTPVIRLPVMTPGHAAAETWGLLRPTVLGYKRHLTR